MPKSHPTLARYLTPHQAAAWVVFRDADFAKACAEPETYHAQKFWPTRPKVGEEHDLHQALIEGSIVALAQRKGEDYTSVPAIAWRRMRVAPQDPQTGHLPYSEVLFDRDQLLKDFPPIDRAKRTGRPPSINYGLIDKLAQDYLGLSLEESAANIRVDYHKECGNDVSDSSVKRRLRQLHREGLK